MERPIPAGNQCERCNDLLGPIEGDETMHPFCAWARASDWQALRPYLDGTLNGVHLAGL